MQADVEHGGHGVDAPETRSFLEVDWSAKAITDRRNQFYSASQRKFVPYREPLILKRGKGQYLWDEKDRRYIDLLGMNLCISVGHAHHQVVRAATEQMADLTHCTTMFNHPVPAQYAEELAATMPPGHDWVVHLTNSGSEAIDLALLMARASTGRIDLLSLASSYHGATFGAQSVTGISGFRHPVPQLGGVTFVPEPNQYRGVHGAATEPYVAEVQRAIDSATSGRLAGLLLEPIQGYGGIVPLPDGYIAGAFERVRAAGGVCIVDEVQAGVGRTGDAFWAFESHGVIPDIVVAAKGIGNGLPLGAVIAKRDVAESMADKFLFHTYGANPVTCAAGRAVLRVISDERLQENAKKVGAALKAELEKLRSRFPLIGDIRGRGLMLAIELVLDRATKEPAAAATVEVFEGMRRHGLVASRSGPYRNVIRMCPPLCLSMSDVDAVVDGVTRSFEELPQ
jgi:alanine-glyoxylate transaminase/(R)-3-amino-2-methylpropionate-pyruvate transaminase